MLFTRYLFGRHSPQPQKKLPAIFRQLYIAYILNIAVSGSFQQILFYYLLAGNQTLKLISSFRKIRKDFRQYIR